MKGPKRIAFSHRVSLNTKHAVHSLAPHGLPRRVCVLRKNPRIKRGGVYPHLHVFVLRHQGRGRERANHDENHRANGEIALRHEEELVGQQGQHGEKDANRLKWPHIARTRVLCAARYIYVRRWQCEVCLLRQLLQQKARVTLCN